MTRRMLPAAALTMLFVFDGARARGGDAGADGGTEVAGDDATNAPCSR